MRVGFHISIAEEFSKVVEQAEIRGCETIQLFSRNPRGWKSHPMDEKEVASFRSRVKEKGFDPVFLHLPYLPNIASRNSKFYKPSIESIMTDLKRAENLGAQYLIIHIGHRMESSEEEAIDAVVHGIEKAFQRVRNSVVLLLENTAGQGSKIGYHFSQIKAIVDRLEEKDIR